MVNYSLYLVTDSTDAILGDRDLINLVQSALEGGVTIVQFRDKTKETADLIRVAKRLHVVTQSHGIPLLINDRVDVALAVGAEGVHIGQEDMDLATTRKIMGEDAIIGVTCSNIQEADAAVTGGANYLGIGTVYSTATKQNTKAIIGTAGVRSILEYLSAKSLKVATVAIGGINASNIQRTMFQSRAQSKALDGVAVVSAIVSANAPEKAATELRSLLARSPPFYVNRTGKALPSKVDDLSEKVSDVVQKLGKVHPLCHNMTNLVVQNFAANVALSIGASPIMSNNASEADDLAKLSGALVVNMGTVTPDGISNYVLAVQAYNKHGGPVLFDPVGAGATQIRRDAVKEIMAGSYFDLIKGNESEICTVAGCSVQQQKGVDGGESDTSSQCKAQLVKMLAARENNVVLMTGPVDYLSDGERTFAISNGNSYLGQITGSGCTLGTAIAAFMAVEREDKLLAALSGILMFEIAAEHAAERPEVRGPGTFIPAFLDALSNIANCAERGDGDWTRAAKIKAIDF